MSNQHYTETESVDAALAELREMFPGRVVWIRQDAYWFDEEGPHIESTVKIGFLRTDPKFKAQTLADCMAQARKWKESQ
jgi:hypothetical protein